MNIYDRIRMLRKELQMSQDELAHKCGYEGKSMISRVESGKIDLPLSKVEVFANALNVSPAYLAGYEQNQGTLDRALYLNDLIKKAVNLDDVDQARIAERIDMLLEQEKYDEN